MLTTMDLFDLFRRCAPLLVEVHELFILVVLVWLISVSRRLARVERHLARLRGELNGHLCGNKKVLLG